MRLLLSVCLSVVRKYGSILESVYLAEVKVVVFAVIFSDYRSQAFTLHALLPIRYFQQLLLVLRPDKCYFIIIIIMFHTPTQVLRSTKYKLRND